MYKQVESENLGEDKDLKDCLGYLGKTEFYREKRVLTHMDENDFLQLISNDNKLKDIMFLIK